MIPRKWSVRIVVALFVFAVGPLIGYGQPLDRPGRFEEFLGLTSEQKAQLEEFRQSGMEERRAHFEKMRTLREEMRAAMKDPEANAGRINGLIDEMSRLRAERMKRGLARTTEMRKIFTPEQREKMSSLRGRTAVRRPARSLRGARSWERPAWQRRPLSHFGRKRPPLDRRLWRW